MGGFVYRTQDDLPEDLREYFFAGDDPGLAAETPFPWFHHPLYVSIMPMLLPSKVEEVLATKQRWADDKLTDGDIGGHVFSYERGYRAGKLIELGHKIVAASIVGGGELPKKYLKLAQHKGLEQKFWKVAADVWVDAEFDDSDPTWARILDMNEIIPGIENMMKLEDRTLLRAAQNKDETLTLYRGVQSSNEDHAHAETLSGFSWTGTLKTAEFFARRFLDKADTPYVAQAQIPAKLAMLHLTQRGEDEYVVPAENLEATAIQIKEIARGK